MLGRHDEAIARFEAAQAAGFLTPYVLFNAGNALRSSGATEEGLRLYREALALFPAFLNVATTLPWACWRPAVPRRLNAPCACCCATSPTGSRPPFNSGICCASQQRGAEAIEAYRLCLQFAPTYPEAWNNLGLALCDVQRHDEALAAYRQALSIDAEFRPSLQNLSQTLVRTKRYEDALIEFRRFLDLDLNVEQRVIGLQGCFGCLSELDRIDDALALAETEPDERLRLICRLHILPVLYNSDDDVAATRRRWTHDLRSLYNALEGLTSDDPHWPALYAHAWAITNFYLAYQMEGRSAPSGAVCRSSRSHSPSQTRAIHAAAPPTGCRRSIADSRGGDLTSPHQPQWLDLGAGLAAGNRFRSPLRDFLLQPG